MIMIAHQERQNQFGIRPQLTPQELTATAHRLNLNPTPSILKRIQNANSIRFNQQYVEMPFVRDGYKVYCVFSQSLEGCGYIVSYRAGKKTWHCSCPDYKFGHQCKHILAFSVMR